MNATKATLVTVRLGVWAESTRNRECLVTENGAVMVYDPSTASHRSDHGLTKAQEARVRRMAAEAVR